MSNRCPLYRLFTAAGGIDLIITYRLATEVSKEIHIPTIGIGAGNGTDGQILVVDDMLGKTKGFNPRFLRRYADLNSIMTDAIGQYITDVKDCSFPNENESY